MPASTRCGSWLAALTLILVANSAWGQNLDILSGKPLGSLVAAAGDTPEKVVSVSAQFVAATANRPALLSVTAKIAPPWYTYSITQKPVNCIPTVLSVTPSDDFSLLGEFRATLSPKIHRDELGGVYETHEPDVTWQVPIEIKPGVDPKGLKIAGRARIQVCKTGSCLNSTNFDFTAALNSGGAKTSGTEPSVGIFSDDNIHATLIGHLSPKTAAAGSTVTVVLTAEPADGWHVYALADLDKGDIGYKPTLIAFSNTSGFAVQRTTADAKPKAEKSEVPGEPTQYFHESPVTWSTTITIPKDAKPGSYPIEGLIGYQTCHAGGCDLPRAARFEGTLTVGTPAVSGESPLAFVSAKYGEAAKLAAANPPRAPSADGETDVAKTSDLSSLPMVILLSLLGGFILNFMPCVLPVIGLKILSFAEQAGRSRGQILALNLWYSLGLLSVFLVLAALASGAGLGLREENLGWGEQFKYTSFNVVMVAVMFTMALSFLGVWEIPIPGFIGSGPATDVAARHGAAGAFAKGVLTTILATPCSGPMLGPVFGLTLNQTPAITFTIFTSIGLGMASPYLLIGAFPSLIRFLPKPGAWMDTFKHIMGFCMLGTIVFFFSFMNRDYLVPTFAMMVGLWAGCWWIGRTSLVETLGRKLKAWTQGAAFAALVGYAAFTWLVPHDSIIPWQNFSRPELAKLTSEGHTVLIDFTADWCATCKANLFFAIETEDVRRLISENKVVPLLADYTDGSSEIKQMLEVLKSASIPVLAIFPSDGSKPIVLTDLITKQDVLKALKDAGPSKSVSGGLTAAMTP